MSISAETLLELAELHLEPEQMAGVLRILGRMQAKEEARREGQRDRVRRHRSKKRYGNVTETLQDGYPPPKKKGLPLHPL